MSKKDDVKKVTMTIRMTEADFAKIRRACYRDELKPAIFAYEKIMKGIEDLIKRQEKHGYQCMTPL